MLAALRRRGHHVPSESYLLASVSGARLRAALEQRIGAFTNERSLQQTSDAEGCYLGQTADTAYLYDGSLTLVMAMSPDFIVNLSGELDALVCALGFETVSGTCWLVAARKGELVRFFDWSTALTEPLSLGEPLASEAARPLTTTQGLYAAVASMGLSFDKNWPSAHKLQLDVPEDLDALQDEQSPLELRTRARDHRARHELSSEAWQAAFKTTLVPIDPGDVLCFPWPLPVGQVKMVPAAQAAQRRRGGPSGVGRVLTWLLCLGVPIACIIWLLR
jgi:hypothetical protein